METLLVELNDVAVTVPNDNTEASLEEITSPSAKEFLVIKVTRSESADLQWCTRYRAAAWQTASAPPG